MIVDDYIMAKRFIKGEATGRAIYLEMYDIIKTVINLDESRFKFPELAICYSTDRTCEFVSMVDKEYIIYDQYLGQTFNMLNRIFLNSTDKLDITCYAYKVLTEIYHFSSEIKMSQICLIAYLGNKEEHKTYKKEKNIDIRSRYTYFQEFFVLMHEVAHWYLSNMDKTSFIHVKRQQLMDYVNSMKNFDDPDRTKSILEDIDAVLGKPYGSFEEYVTIEEYNKLDVLLENAQKNLFNDATIIINTSDDFIEECLCDDIATNLLIKIMMSMYDVSIEECLQIIYMGLQNLELLTILRAEVAKKEERNTMPTYLMELILRNSHFRKVIPILNLNSEQIKKCNDMFIESNRKFTKIIKDPVLFILTNILDELRKIDTKTEYPLKVNHEKYNTLIREL